MDPESSLSSKAWENARGFKIRLCSDFKKGKTHDSVSNSVEKKSQNLKRRRDHANGKPRSKWPDRLYKQHKLSENIGATVKRTKSTSSGHQGLEDGVRKQSVANQLVELEEGEIPPSPENYLDSTTSDQNDLEEIYEDFERPTFLDKLKKPAITSKEGKTNVIVDETGIPEQTIETLQLMPGVEIQHTDKIVACSGSPKVAAHIFESDTYSSVVQVIGQKGVVSARNLNNHQVGTSPCEDPHHGPLDEVAMVDMPASTQSTMQIPEPSIINLQLPQLSNVQISGNNVEQFRSMTSGSASMNKLPRYDPLQFEIERLKTHYEQDFKMHHAMICQLKSRRYKDMEELLKKYEVLFRGADAAFQHKTVEFNSKVQKVYQNKLLAAAVMLKHNDDEEAVTPETKPAESDLVNQLFHNSTLYQQPPVAAVMNQPSLVAAKQCLGGSMGSYSSGFDQSGFIFRAAASYVQTSISQSQSLRTRSLFPVLNNGTSSFN